MSLRPPDEVLLLLAGAWTITNSRKL
jgi:hypothetical protein